MYICRMLPTKCLIVRNLHTFRRLPISINRIEALKGFERCALVALTVLKFKLKI